MTRIELDVPQMPTGLLGDILEGIDNLDDLKAKYLSQLKCESAAWQTKIEEIVRENQYTQEQLAEKCGVTRPAVAKWLKGAIPCGRDTFIRIGLAAHYNLEQMNKFLVRYGKCPALYAKSLEDSVYIFVLSSKTLPHTYTECSRVAQRIKEALAGGSVPREIPKAALKGTAHLEDTLKRLSSEEELQAFVQENLPEYGCAFSKFYDQVMAFLFTNYRSFAETGKDGTVLSINVDRLGNANGWSSSLMRCLYNIQRRIWFPRRRKIISLGLHLNMMLDEINELLQLAQMETLCARDPVESAIIFAVIDADLNGLIPARTAFQKPQAAAGLEGYVQEVSVLCDHVRKTLEYLDLPDAETLIRDLLIEW